MKVFCGDLDRVTPAEGAERSPRVAALLLAEDNVVNQNCVGAVVATRHWCPVWRRMARSPSMHTEQSSRSDPMDVKMPVRSGFDATAASRDRAAHRGARADRRADRESQRRSRALSAAGMRRLHEQADPGGSL